MRILVLPRNPNPYQELLYGEMRRLGTEVTYIGELTPSQTLNLLLLPLETAIRRVAGSRLIHLHWVFSFTFPGARRFPVLRRVAYIWFLIWLRTCHMLGMRLVWTAHNVLPHEPVFPDDLSARRALARASSLVLCHSQSTLAELASLGIVARRSAVIQHGPIAPTSSTDSPRALGSDGEPRRFLFFGRVQEYKGVDDLLTAFLAIPDNVGAHLTVAGQCDDPGLRSGLCALAAKGGPRVVLRLGYVPQEEVTPLFAAADVVVLPFRRITTSGSAIVALAHGRPLIVPDLPALADLPDQAVLRYDRSAEGLADALSTLARADRAILAAMSAAAVNYVAKTTWREIAEETAAQVYLVLGGNSEADVRDRPVAFPVK
jgi:glycosyltransferase involved in cell wall biosynthesis